MTAKTSILLTCHGALTKKKRGKIKKNPERLVSILFHAVPELTRITDRLNADAGPADFVTAEWASTTARVKDLDAEVAAPASWVVLSAIARNPHTPAPLLADILVLTEGAARDGDRRARHYVLQHPNLPACLIDWAVGATSDHQVQEAVAMSPNLSLDQQIRLARSADEDVMEALIANPVTSTGIRNMLIRQLLAVDESLRAAA